MHSEGSFEVHWSHAEAATRFAIVDTHSGALALGFSSDGQMSGSEAVIGWADANADGSG